MTTNNQGLYPFGKEIKIESNLATYPTNEYLVMIEGRFGYAFRYYPVERNLYKGTIHVTRDVLYKVAMDTNSSWFNLIEINGMNPEKAYKRLKELKNEIIEALIYTIGWGPGEATWKDELKTSLSYQHDIIKEGVGASKLDRVKRFRPRVRVR